MQLVSNLGYILYSVGQLNDKDIHSLFYSTQVRLEHQDRFGVGHGNCHQRSRLYTLPNPIDDTSSSTKLVATEKRSSLLRDRRLAHLIEHDLQKVLVNFKGVPGINDMEEVCRPCHLGKAHKVPFQCKFERAKKVGK